MFIGVLFLFSIMVLLVICGWIFFILNLIFRWFDVYGILIIVLVLMIMCSMIPFMIILFGGV